MKPLTQSPMIGTSKNGEVRLNIDDDQWRGIFVLLQEE